MRLPARNAYGMILSLCVFVAVPPAAAVNDDDRQGVKKAALAHWDSLRAGDKVAFSASMTSREPLVLVQRLAMFDGALEGRRLHDALQKFGADGQKVSDQYHLADPDLLRTRIEGAQVTVDGETAKLEDDTSLHWKFRRDGGRWKVDVTPDTYTAQELAINIDSHTRVARARAAVADEILAGTIKSAPDARAALEKKSMPPPRPSTRPSTGPTSRRPTTNRITR